MQRPVWLLSMDSEQFNAPPTTTAGLASYYRQYGKHSADTSIELVHFQHIEDIEAWLTSWSKAGPQQIRAAAEAGLRPLLGFSVYTWNAAEFLELAHQLRRLAPELTLLAGGPHVQQAEDYLGEEALDVIFLGEAEVTFQQFLDSETPDDWQHINGLAYLKDNTLIRTPARERCRELDRFPSPLDVLELTHPDGTPRYAAIAYETSRGCPFKCAFCEWGTGAIGSKMYQWSLARVRDDWEKITAAGIANIWLADSNFGALKQDLEKARMIVEMKERTGLPRSFATSWSKKHSRQVQEIALLLHRNQLLPHYQLALQTLTPEALRLSNRQNMSANEYQPIARQMSEEGVPIAAELIWGLPGDNLADFERNLDTLLATFPSINIFGYTLLPGTEFYARREEYRIEAIPVAGYGKAKGEYVVGCHSFSRDEGEEGYFMISAHIVLVHGHIMPLTTRLLALQGSVPVSPLLRECLREIISSLSAVLPSLDHSDRMAVYEQRNQIYLAALAAPEQLYTTLHSVISAHCQAHGQDPQPVLQALALDQALCPRVGPEQDICERFDFAADELQRALSAMNLPTPATTASGDCTLRIRHPGGVGDILRDADGGSWLRGVILAREASTSDTLAVALA